MIASNEWKTEKATIAQVWGK